MGVGVADIPVLVVAADVSLEECRGCRRRGKFYSRRRNDGGFIQGDLHIRSLGTAVVCRAAVIVGGISVSHHLFSTRGVICTQSSTGRTQ